MEHLLDTPKSNDLIYDVGLHKGEDAEFYLSKGFHVVGFEADPDLASHCREKLRHFLDRGQMTIVEGAIVDPGFLPAGEKKVRFYKNNYDSVWGTVLSSWAAHNDRVVDSRFRNTGQKRPDNTLEVDAIQFEDALRMYGVPYYMKIDIEGCDMACLNALRAFKQRPSFISVEFTGTAQEIDLLTELGYTSFQAVNQATVFRNRPPRPSREGVYVEHRFEAGASGLFGRELNGRWLSKDATVRRYNRIVRIHRLFGNGGKVFLSSKNLAARFVNALTRRLLCLVTRRTVPGWHDIHARHAGDEPKT